MGAAEVSSELERLLRGIVAGTIEPIRNAPPGAEPWLEDLVSRADTYRDAALIVLAYVVDAGSVANVAVPPPGRRTVGQKLATLLDELNISARRDVFQTLAKGTDSLLGRQRPAWNHLLEWVQVQGSLEPVEVAMIYLATRIADTARDLPLMPDLEVRRLTFQRMGRIIDCLLAHPSGGAHEQFLFAALLQAAAEEYGNRRVKTKALHASDASAGTAADVQLLEGGRVIEAYEVTANSWSTKLFQAAAVLRHYDLPRIHIVAHATSLSASDIHRALAGVALPAGLTASTVDISVLDVRHECRSLVHRISRPGRRAALSKLWEHLAMRQPNDALVREYIELLAESGVTAGNGS